jgi:hypothetical protein
MAEDADAVAAAGELARHEHDGTLRSAERALEWAGAVERQAFSVDDEIEQSSSP